MSATEDGSIDGDGAKERPRGGATPLDVEPPVRLRRALLAWYRPAKRDLPWRRTSDPYAIWLSETMLQQTRVEVVIDYWTRFLERLPDVAALARADEEEVVALWSGLGYYRRARQLHAAGRAVVERFGGAFPRTAAGLRELPGVGPYTAGAVASIAFDAPEPLVDGNVARVLCRLFELDGEAGSSALQRKLWELAGALVPRRGAGEWNQALMELGATVCGAANPDCARCPVASACRARAAGRERELPRPKRRPAPVDVELEVFLVERRGRVLLRRRGDSDGRMAGMWELPTLERTRTGLHERELEPPVLDGLRPSEPLAELRHSITRHRIRARLARAALPVGARVAPPFAWFERDALAELPLTGMTRKALAAT